MNHQKKNNVTQKLICRLDFQAPLLCPLGNKKKSSLTFLVVLMFETERMGEKIVFKHRSLGDLTLLL